MYEAERTVSNVTSVWSRAVGGVGKVGGALAVEVDRTKPPNNPTIATALSMSDRNVSWFVSTPYVSLLPSNQEDTLR